MGATYELSPDRTWIRCLRCGRTSHHPGDVENLYCGACGHHGRADPLDLTPNEAKLLRLVEAGERPALADFPSATFRVYDGLRRRGLVGSSGATDLGRKAIARLG